MIHLLTLYLVYVVRRDDCLLSGSSSRRPACDACSRVAKTDKEHRQSLKRKEQQ